MSEKFLTNWAAIWSFTNQNLVVQAIEESNVTEIFNDKLIEYRKAQDEIKD